MDSERAKQIMRSPEPIQVLHNGSPVWIERVKENNTAEISYLENQRKEVVPVYMLVENSPANS
ncbi:MAG: H-type small acid-soluble spore protein [Clostridia bacterium]|nr:H-type small acid-soluble spore protein [Clostridia bacterium]